MILYWFVIGIPKNMRGNWQVLLKLKRQRNIRKLCQKNKCGIACLLKYKTGKHYNIFWNTFQKISWNYSMDMICQCFDSPSVRESSSEEWPIKLRPRQKNTGTKKKQKIKRFRLSQRDWIHQLKVPKLATRPAVAEERSFSQVMGSISRLGVGKHWVIPPGNLIIWRIRLLLLKDWLVNFEHNSTVHCNQQWIPHQTNQQCPPPQHADQRRYIHKGLIRKIETYLVASYLL